MFPRALTAAALLAAAGTALAAMPPEPAPLARPFGTGAAYPYQPLPQPVHVLPAGATDPIPAGRTEPPAQLPPLVPDTKSVAPVKVLPAWPDMAPAGPAARPALPNIPVAPPVAGARTGPAPKTPAPQTGTAKAPAAPPAGGPVTPAPLPPTAAVAPKPAPCPCPATACLACPPPGPVCWGAADYLFFFLKPTPVPPPLTVNGVAPIGGIAGAPGTFLLASADTDYGTFAGLRVIVGGWLNRHKDVGVEASGLLLENRVIRSSLTPVVNLPPGLAVPPLGFVQTRENARLWGAGFDTLYRLTATRRYSVDALAGFRFLSLEEGLSVTTRTPPTPAGLPLFIGTNDRFSTQNRFYGGDLGLRLGYTTGPFFAALTGRVSLGTVHEAIAVDSTRTVLGPAGTTVLLPGGFLAGTGNNGRYTKDEFAVMPEVGFKAGVRLTSHLLVTGGYDFIYLSRVVRPGDQLDSAGIAARLTGAPAAASTGVPFNRTDFYAHGASVGLTLTY